MRTSGSKPPRPSRARPSMEHRPVGGPEVRPVGERPGERIVPIDRDARPGRLGGGSVAFGAPGPKIDVAKFLEATQSDATIGGSEAGAAPAKPAPPAAPSATPTAPVRQTVAFSDGTKVSFVAVHDLLELQND